MNIDHEATKYNIARRHAFRLLHLNPHGKGNEEKQIAYIKSVILEKYDLMPTSSAGLIAEVRFLDRYRDELCLGAALDCGDKTDFFGFLNEQPARIDVTTKLECKNLEIFETQDSNARWKYHIIEIDKETGRIVRVVPEISNISNQKDVVEAPSSDGDLKNDCEESLIVDLLIFHRADTDEDGCSKYNPYLELVTVDLENNNKIIDEKICTDWYIEAPATFVQGLPDEMSKEEIEFEIEAYCDRIVRFLNKQYGCMIMGCLTDEYRIFSPDGEGDYGYYYKWLHPLLEYYGYHLDEEMYFDQ